MNCEAFNKIIDDLADYKPMSATIRDASVSHAALCPDCATKLADARAVGSCLLAATRAESEQAPARVKENLLAAFAAQHANAAPVVDISSRRKQRPWFAAAATIAAVILLTVGISVWKLVSVSGPQPPTNLRADLPPTPPTPQVDSPNPGSSSIDQGRTGPDRRAIAKDAGVNPRKLRQLPRESVGQRSGNETVVQNSGAYLPLTYLAAGTTIESGTVVRIELSRSALASLGFTGSVEGSGESVKADVILGDDGVARAIRLVD